MLMPIQVVIIDEEQLLTDALTLLMESTSEFTVVGRYTHHHEALTLLAVLKPDVVLCDVKTRYHMTEDIVEEISRHPKIHKFLVLTRSVETSEVMLCLRAGVKGYILKNQPHDELLFALKRISAGGVHYCMEAQEAQLRAYGSSAVKPYGLSAREKEILQLLCEDQSPKDIALRLNVDRKTVDSHKRHIFSKLGIQTMSQLIKFALQHDLITL